MVITRCMVVKRNDIGFGGKIHEIPTSFNRPIAVGITHSTV